MKKIYFMVFFSGISLLFIKCKKEEKTNEKLFEEATSGDLVFYQNKDSILKPAGGSPHGNFKLKFNTAATAQFGSDGKFPSGNNFQDGSLIVKEVYSGGNLSLYAVMKKDSKSKFSGSGWLWAEYELNGNARFSIGKKGDGCISCHSNSPNRDLTRSFDLH